MKIRKLWVGIPLIIVVLTVLFAVMLTGCDPGLNEDQLIGRWGKSGSTDYTVEFTSNKLIITDNTGGSPKTKTYYYTTNGSQLTIKQNESDNQPLGIIGYSFPSEGSLTINSNFGSESIAGTYISLSSSSQPGNNNVATPTANPSGGAVTSGTTVTLSSTTTGVDIYYTTNGNDPTTSSNKGTSVTITAATTIKAIAVKDGVSSTVLTASYTISSGGTLNAITVTSGNDSGTGTLRQALADIAPGGTITINASVGTITLTSGGRLLIDKDVTINGNGVIITRGTNFPTTNNSLMENGNAAGSGKTVNIERIHFKEGKDSGTGNYGNGAAIYNYGGGSISINSCIFTLNETNMGGAIFNAGNASAFVRGCTFYSNKATTSGGAIYHNTGTLSLTGNVFYMNTAPGSAATSGPIVFNSGGTVTSGGYNIVDVAFGTGANQCGWTQGTDDTLSTSSPFVSTTGGNAFSLTITLSNKITTLPVQFPTTYFDGSARTAPASAGAVK